MGTIKTKTIFGNIDDIGKYKPADSAYDNIWINFWCSMSGAYKPNACCVTDCSLKFPDAQDDIVGGHVCMMSTELSKAIESDLNNFC